MIVSFADAAAEAIHEGRTPGKGFPSDLVFAARRKLRMLHAAERLDDLRSPPGNRLEPLVGDWRGFHSIRINDQWRLCFRWTPVGPEAVQIVDYH
jgi:toxin HigB-1